VIRTGVHIAADRVSNVQSQSVSVGSTLIDVRSPPEKTVASRDFEMEAPPVRLDERKDVGADWQ
jgi:hypothetical protein